MATRARSNTCDAALAPERVSDSHVCVIGEEPIAYNSRTTALVSGFLLRHIPTAASSSSEGKTASAAAADAAGAGAAGAGAAAAHTAAGDERAESKSSDNLPDAISYTFQFTLTEACKWRGERCLFSRGNDGAQVPAVYVVGPYSTLRVRVAPPPASGTGVSPFGAARGRRSPRLRSPTSARSRSKGAGAGTAAATTINSSPEAPVVEAVELHVAIVMSRTTLRFFLNGELCKETAVTVKDWEAACSSSLSMCRNSRFEGVPATIRNFHVYTRELSAEEVRDSARTTLEHK